MLSIYISHCQINCKDFIKKISAYLGNKKFSPISCKILCRRNTGTQDIHFFSCTFHFIYNPRRRTYLKPFLKYHKNPETPIQKNLCTPMFVAEQFTIAKYWKQPKCPSANEWIKKLWCIHTTEFYAAERKKELVPFATAWMEVESIMLSEMSRVVRDKYYMISPFTGT